MSHVFGRGLMHPYHTHVRLIVANLTNFNSSFSVMLFVLPVIHQLRLCYVFRKLDGQKIVKKNWTPWGTPHLVTEALEITVSTEIDWFTPDITRIHSN